MGICIFIYVASVHMLCFEEVKNALLLVILSFLTINDKQLKFEHFSLSPNPLQINKGQKNNVKVK